MRRSLWLSFICVSFGVLCVGSASCGPGTAVAPETDTDTDDTCPVGTVGCPCTDGGSCDVGLACYSGLCVDGSATVSTFPTSNPTEPVTTVNPETSTTAEPATTFDTTGDSTSMQSSGSSTSTTGPTGCSAVDITFVVDNSASVLEQQTRLTSAFPGFVDALTTDLAEVTDVHIGVVTTDAYAYNGPGCNQLGALVTSTGGAGSSISDCGPYAAGSNFMTLDDDLPTAFACAAAVGTSGSGFEMPMAAMLAAVDGTHGAGPGCNEGFIREQAIGVVVVFTDEWDGPEDPEAMGSPGSPDSWFSDLVDTKNDDETRFVVGLLVNEPTTCEPAEIYYDTSLIIEFAEQFTHRIIAGQCEEGYGPFMSDLVDEIVAACAAYNAG